jgi:hypothetical protein
MPLMDRSYLLPAASAALRVASDSAASFAPAAALVFCLSVGVVIFNFLLFVVGCYVFANSGNAVEFREPCLPVQFLFPWGALK